MVFHSYTKTNWSIEKFILRELGGIIRWQSWSPSRPSPRPSWFSTQPSPWETWWRLPSSEPWESEGWSHSPRPSWFSPQQPGDTEWETWWGRPSSQPPPWEIFSLAMSLIFFTLLSAFSMMASFFSFSFLRDWIFPSATLSDWMMASFSFLREWMTWSFSSMVLSAQSE